MGFQSINSTILTKSTNELAFKLTSFKNLDVFDHLVRYNYYSIILIEKGGFQLKIDLDTYDVLPETTICFSPYQPFMMTSNEETVGYMLNILHSYNLWAKICRNMIHLIFKKLFPLLLYKQMHPLEPYRLVLYLFRYFHLL